MNHEETTKSWSLSFVTKCQLHCIRNFELCHVSASSAVRSISVLNGSLYHETCIAKQELFLHLSIFLVSGEGDQVAF